MYLKQIVWCKRSGQPGWSSCFWGVNAALNAFGGFYFGQKLVSPCALNILRCMFQSGLNERYMRNVCFLACKPFRLSLTLGGAILAPLPFAILPFAQCWSHADGCSLSLPLPVILVKRLHMQKQVYFLFDSCSGFVFCFCSFIHATIVPTA